MNVSNLISLGRIHVTRTETPYGTIIIKADKIEKFTPDTFAQTLEKLQRSIMAKAMQDQMRESVLAMSEFEVSVEETIESLKDFAESESGARRGRGAKRPRATIGRRKVRRSDFE